MSGLEVAILAGGEGTRLRARTGARPKPLVPVIGVPLLDYQIALCRRHGFSGILLLVRHGHDAIRAHLGDGGCHGVRVEYQIDAQPRGTGGALRDALPRLADTFLVLYGDTFLDVDLRQMRETHARRGADATLFVHPNDHPHDSDLIEVDDRDFVTALFAPPHHAPPYRHNLANAALFVMNRRGLEELISRETPADLARDVFPAMLRAGRRLAAYRSPEYIKDVGTPERLDQVERDIRAGVPERLSGRSLRSAVFLDRDGTLNDEMNYLTDAARLRLFDGVDEAVRRLNRAGRVTIVVTNQAVIARGELTAAGLDDIHRRLGYLLGRRGAYVDSIYVCPHHPDRGYPGELAALKIECDCRKPRTGLIDAACRDLLIDRAASWLVGDTTSDIEAGRRAGVRTLLVRTGYAGQDGRYPFRPDYVTTDLGAAVSWVLEGHAVMRRRMAPVATAGLDARLVLIGGLARSGKSSAAQILKEEVTAFGRSAHILPLDSWLKPQAERAEGTGVVSRFDLPRLLADIGPIIRSADRHPLEIPVYDRARRCMYEHPLHVAIGPEDLLIIEGVPALLAEELVGLADLKVHIETSEAPRIAQVRADYRWRGEPDTAVDALLASRAIDETIPVQEARTRADFVVAAWTDA